MITAIQTWGFRKGCVSHTVGDPDKARAYVREALAHPYVREVCVWWPDHTITHATRALPHGPWRVVKGSLPE